MSLVEEVDILIEAYVTEVTDFPEWIDAHLTAFGKALRKNGDWEQDRSATPVTVGEAVGVVFGIEHYDYDDARISLSSSDGGRIVTLRIESGGFTVRIKSVRDYAKVVSKMVAKLEK